ncbi:MULTISPECIES: outer membrane protein assembly factor BamC [Nitrincola]|uniref:Lipoprotein n=1 Tax=Nitrincola nitratireducens TaxID=1229521 RepID=W9UW65_9GAMM|nr:MULTISPECIES: outer membrane protein assembly factor BamC [Nitrincola]EXJ11488.1 lipoprotein [Nitrincola nitratireducens]
MRKVRLSTVMTGTLLLSIGGCSMVEKNPIYGEHAIIRDRSQDYTLAEGGQRLQIPDHIRARPMQDQLTVPDVGLVGTQSQERFQVPRPEFFYSEPGSETVNLQRFDGDRVIIVDEPIADVWQKVVDFWEFNGVNIARKDPRMGTIETEWIRTDGRDYSFMDRWIKRLTLQGLEGPSDNKIRVSVRPDPEDYARTSIRMQHVQFAQGAVPANVDWDASVADISYQSEMMFEMLRYLSRTSAQPTAQSLLALEQRQRSRPQLGRDSRGNPALRISTDAQTAWGLLDAAVDASGFDVGTRDERAGIFYLTYTTSTPFDDTQKMGFFEWLHSDRGDIKLNTNIITNALGLSNDTPEGNVRYSSEGMGAASRSPEEIALDLNDPDNPANQQGYKIWLGGRVLYVFGSGQSGFFNRNTGEVEHTGRYQVKLNRMRQGVMVTVLNDQGIEAPGIVAEEILWQIKDQLPQGI